VNESDTRTLEPLYGALVGRRSFSRVAVATVCLGAIAAAPAARATSSAAAAYGCPYVQFVPSQTNLPQIRASTLCLINAVRTRAGLPLLHTTPALRLSAQSFALDMMHDNFFDHATPTGRTLEERAGAAGYGRGTTGWEVGEIIAWGEDEDGTPMETLQSWMSSPSHRSAILDRDWTDIGIGAAYGAPETIEPDFTAATYAVDFGIRGTTTAHAARHR
jgi:uncharacterized protein YkwD